MPDVPSKKINNNKLTILVFIIVLPMVTNFLTFSDKYNFLCLKYKIHPIKTAVPGRYGPGTVRKL